MAQLKGTGKASRLTIFGVTITASDLMTIAYSINTDIADSTGMGQTYKTHEVTQSQMTFTVNGFADMNVQASIDAASFLAACNAARTDSDGKGVFSIYATGITGASQEVTGSCTMTAFNVNYPHSDMATIDASFTVDGTPTFEAGPS